MSSSIPILKVNNAFYETDQQKAELFADRLTLTFSEEKNPNFNDNFRREINNATNNNKLRKICNNNSAAPLITKDELIKAIINLSDKESSDSYDISNRLLHSM